MTAALEAGFTNVTIDLAEVDVIDSYGFRTLLSVDRRLADAGGTLVLAADRMTYPSRPCKI